MTVNLGLPEFISGLPSFKNESEYIWSRCWVAAGVSEMIHSADTVLPSTIGDHGVHLLRHKDGTIDAGYNAFQQGSCWTIPAQCGNGAKIDCPYVSCGHSRDGEVLSPEREDHHRLIHQVVGARPMMRATIPFKQRGPVLFIAMPGNEESALTDQTRGCAGVLTSDWDHYKFQGYQRYEVAMNWRYVASRVEEVVANTFQDEGFTHIAPPNLIVVESPSARFVMTNKPVNFTRTEISIAIYSTADDFNESAEDTVQKLLGDIEHIDKREDDQIAIWADKLYENSSGQ